MVKNVLPSQYETKRKHREKWKPDHVIATKEQTLIIWFQLLYYVKFLIIANIFANELFTTINDKMVLNSTFWS